MTEKMKSVCVGRYLVDVPVEAEIGFSGSMLDGFDIVTIEEDEAAFRERIAAREAEIESRPADPATNTEAGMLEKRDLRIPNMIGRTFIYGRSRGYMMDGDRRVNQESVSVESHAHINGVSFSLSAHPAEEGSAREAEALLARVQLRDVDEIPKVQGFCVTRAVFVDPLPAHTNEHIVMHLGLPEHPDLGLNLASIAGARPGPGLLARTVETDTTTSPDVLLRMTKLREGKRSINGVDGEELLLRAREYNFTTTYGFNWEAPGKTNDSTLPFLSLELRTGMSERPGGKPVETSLHEDALIELWNTIVSSIRFRKNGPPPPTTSSEPPGPKLGAVARAGDVCPQSGWWRCAEGGPQVDVHGGQMQYIRKGERMPQALLLPRQTLWQKIKRIQPSVESTQPTAWTLVDKRLRPRTTTSVALAPPMLAAAGLDTKGGGSSRAPLGSFVRTGEACPSSGWWRCQEPHALDGTRWFARDALLPPATFQVPAGVFAKSSGPEHIQRRSMWQLVRHAESPVATQEQQAAAGVLPVAQPPTVV